MKKAPTGRPSLRRNKTAGKNLKVALKFLGKTWRKDVHSPKHIRNWNAWIDLNLPTSATTIDRDVREGIPEHRIAAYAQCLGIAPKALCAARTNMVKALGNVAAPLLDSETPEPPANLPFFAERYPQHNNSEYLHELFALMGGVYRMHYLLQGIDLIHRCTLWMYDIGKHSLLLKGRFLMFGNENPFEARMFRWHNNLHAHYLCDNSLELGYTMYVDPLRHNLIRQRKPFWLHGIGMTDRGLADNQPITITLRMNQLQRPDGMTPEQLWLEECENMRQRPFLSPGENDYEAVWAEVSTPDELL